MELPVHDLWLFAAAALLVNLTPGPDMLFVAGTSLAHGRGAGVRAALGVGLGCVLHTVLAVVGLAALLAASPVAFTAVQWAGAAFLVWMGVQLLRKRGEGVADAASAASANPSRVFWQGALTNALNPKVALFFLAFLPQFIDTSRGGSAALGFIVLGTLFNVGGTAVNVGVALAAGALRGTLGGRGAAGAWLQRAAGVVFVALGLRLALSAR